MTPMIKAFKVNSTSAHLAGSLVYLKACGMERKTPVVIGSLRGTH